MNWPIFTLGLALTIPGVVAIVLFIRQWVHDERAIKQAHQRRDDELDELIADSYTEADFAWLDTNRITM